MTAAAKGAQPLDAFFIAPISKDGAFPTYLELPAQRSCSVRAVPSRSPGPSTVTLSRPP